MSMLCVMLITSFFFFTKNKVSRSVLFLQNNESELYKQL